MGESRRRLSIGSIAVPSVLLVLTTMYLVEALGLGAPLDRHIPTPSFVPLVLVGLMYLSLAVVLWKTWRGAAPQHETKAATAISERKPLLVFLAASLYVLSFAYAGYVITTPVFVYVMLHLYGFGEPKSVSGQAKRIAAAVALTALVYAFFVAGFSVRLPGIGS